RLAIAFTGRPNVGKSSLCNRLLNAERMVVSEIPGTTRDAVGINLDYTGGDGKVWPFKLVDTAGLRRKGRVSSSVEYFSTLRSQDAIQEAQIVFLVIDAMTGVTQQDKTLAREVVDAGKCVALV
ncbi:GTPase, partial [Arthrospira platensis SPKY1]|nr:GTPase [Arthrospira platensis SPKY1]